MKYKNEQWTIQKGAVHSPGITRCPQGVHFAVEIPHRVDAELVLYHKDTGRRSIISLANACRVGNVLAFVLENFPYGQYTYTYRINGEEKPDKYAISLRSRSKRQFGTWNRDEKSGFSCEFFQEEEFDWEEDACPQIPLHQVILYSMHVRGFTKHRSSKVASRGTFRGIMEKIPYLKELGINQLELMPVYEFKEVIEKKEMLYPQYMEENSPVSVNYWGYSEENYYYAIKKTYAESEDERTEFKTLVRELHKNGIEVILEFYFPKETRVGFVTDCLKYWLLEYHVDGFRISGTWNGARELLKEPLLADKKIYGGYLDEEVWQEAVAAKERRAAVYSIDYLTNMRSFLKGDSGKVMEAAYYMRRNGKYSGFVNFFAAHDGFTMMDMVSYEHKHNDANQEGNQDGWDYNYSWNCGIEGKTKKKMILELRKKQLKNAWVMLLLSQGIPGILAGDERCNSQNGNNNVYCQDNETGWLNWNTPKVYEELYEFVRKLIQFRKEHPVFHMPKEVTMTDSLGKGYPDLSYHSDKVWYMDAQYSNHYIGMLYCGDYAGELETQENSTAGDDYFYVALNMGWNTQKFAIPDLPKNRMWHRLIDTAAKESFLEETQLVGERLLEVLPRTIVVLIGKKLPGKENHGRKRKRAK